MHRITALLSSLALLAGLFVYAPQSVRAADPIYIGPGGGSGECAVPDYITNGIADNEDFEDAADFQDGDIDNVLYVCPGTYDMDAEVTLAGALTIAGVSGAASTILDASESTDRILYTDSTLIITRLTFQNAETLESGAAIYASDDLIVQNSIFLNNHSFRRGALLMLRMFLPLQAAPSLQTGPSRMAEPFIATMILILLLTAHFQTIPVELMVEQFMLKMIF